MASGKLVPSLVLVLLCTSFAGSQAQSEESAAIIQTTIMAFRVTGGAASNFSTATQTKFSDSLRGLLQSFNFMSIAVSDYTSGSGYVDVSVRAVDATDAQNLTSTWETIANQALVTNTFMSTFNALLTNAGTQANASLVSVNGATTPAGTNVTFTVDMVLSGGMNLSPFGDSSKQALLQPIIEFLGDHGTASIATVNETNGQVNVKLNVTLDANTMPQFWFFITNQTALQSSLPSLGGNSLNSSIAGHTVVGSAAKNATAQAPGPAAPAAAAPPVSATAASGPVTAAEASGAPVPPVSQAASGTVTMNIGMTLYGSDVQPFTSEAQFAAASSMAGVFWIVVGTGSVQLISFSSTTATSQPESTAKATTQQYGRKLLQSAGNSSSNGTIPAENVVFAVTLPSASQNSLLVLQSSSPEVRRQFAGWFVSQMQARGYTVDADVTSVSLSSVSSPAPSGSVAAAAGSSTNVGAIVGGVVGGVCAVALIALVFMWLYYRNQRRRDVRKKEAALARDSPENFKAGGYWDPDTKPGTFTNSSIYTKDADELKQSIIYSLSNTNSFMSSETPLYRSPLYSRITELDSAHVDDVKRLLHKRKLKESSPLTHTSEHQAAALLSALSSLETGSLYYDKYVVEQSQRRGVNSIIAYAHLKEAPAQQVVIKFLPDHGLYKREKLFYENRQALEGEAAAAFIPVMFDAFDGSPVADVYSEEDDSIPPSLVLERGNFTLADWLSGKAVTSLEGRPEDVDRNQTLYNLCKAVEFLHARSLVHGSLSPDTLMWFAPLKKWKLIGFGNWARDKESMRVRYDLRYAPPELLLADLAGMQQIHAAEATDMWALGCIAFELLSGRSIFGDQFSEEEIMSMLLGFVKLPWEENPEFFTDNLPPAARNFVADLLHRAPEARKPITTVLHSALFVGEATPGAAGAPTQELKTPANLFSTTSEW